MNLIENIECDHIGNTPLPNEQELGRGITKISGIYKIINKIDGKYYVGSSQDINKRWNSHLNELNRDNHWNIHLQRAWNKYGKNSFDFTIYNECSVNDLFECEQSELNICKMDVNSCYNINFDAYSPMRGRKHTIESKLKMKESHSGKIRSIEHCKNLSLALSGRFMGSDHRGFNIPLTNAHKMKISLSNSGKIRTDETRKKMSLAKSGINSYKYNHTIYRFFNKKLNIHVECTKHQLENKYNLVKINVSRIISGERKSHRGWVIL